MVLELTIVRFVVFITSSIINHLQISSLTLEMSSFWCERGCWRSPSSSSMVKLQYISDVQTSPC